MSGAGTQPGEAARVLAALVPSLPGEAVRDLQALLAHRLAFISPALAREMRLGLLLDLVAVSDGELPSTDDYEHERARRVGRGERWPAASTLARGFNGWYRACAAAMRLHHVGGPARVPSDHTHGGAGKSYTRAEVLDPIRRFHARERSWPTYSEFFAWGAAARKHARRTGAADPRIPNPKQVRRACGTFALACRAAQELHDAAGSG